MPLRTGLQLQQDIIPREKINESTARRLKGEYVEKFNEEMKDRKKKGKSADTEPVVIKKLPTKDRGRPLKLGEQLDAAVQEYVESLRKANGGVNTLVVMGAANTIKRYSYNHLSETSWY